MEGELGQILQRPGEAPLAMSWDPERWWSGYGAHSRCCAFMTGTLMGVVDTVLDRPIHGLELKRFSNGCCPTSALGVIARPSSTSKPWRLNQPAAASYSHTIDIKVITDGEHHVLGRHAQSALSRFVSDGRGRARVAAASGFRGSAISRQSAGSGVRPLCLLRRRPGHSRSLVFSQN